MTAIAARKPAIAHWLAAMAGGVAIAAGVGLVAAAGIAALRHPPPGAAPLQAAALASLERAYPLLISFWTLATVILAGICVVLFCAALWGRVFSSMILAMLSFLMAIVGSLSLLTTYPMQLYAWAGAAILGGFLLSMGCISP